MESETARRLRTIMTDAERKLWSLLLRKQLQGFRFRRQVPLGRYVADFACMCQRPHCRLALLDPPTPTLPLKGGGRSRCGITVPLPCWEG
jgi:hypothetical protein